MIGNDSPLRRLPSALNARQSMFCDGVRFAIEMLDCAYARLVVGTEQLATEDQDGISATPAMFLDAWSVVDSANRLRALVDEFPNMKKNTPMHQALVRALRPAEALRNSVQHLPGDIVAHAEAGLPTWGVLHWTRLDSETGARGFILVPGAARTMSQLGKMRAPAGRTFHYNPDFVTLEAYGAEADLSAIHRAVASYVPKLEQALGDAFKDIEDRAGSDLLMTLQFKFGPAQGETGDGQRL